MLPWRLQHQGNAAGQHAGLSATQSMRQSAAPAANVLPSSIPIWLRLVVPTVSRLVTVAIVKSTHLEMSFTTLQVSAIKYGVRHEPPAVHAVHQMPSIYDCCEKSRGRFQPSQKGRLGSHVRGFL